jgi:protein TonB
MRWFACVLLLMVSVDIRAGEAFLIPEHNPKPIYPRALSGSVVTALSANT